MYEKIFCQFHKHYDVHEKNNLYLLSQYVTTDIYMYL